MAKKNIQIVYTVTDAALIKSAKAIRDNEKAAKDADAAVNKFGKDAQKAGNDASKSFLKLGDVWKGLIAIGIVNFVTNLGKKILDLGVKQEQLNIAFETFLGSATAAKKLLAELTKFAIVTPFSPDQVNSAAKALLAFGVAGKDIIPTLKMLGDVSSGTGKDLTEMAIIFGQIRSTGRLMGQDLLQLINAGFNPLQVISEKTGKSVGDLKKEMEKGLITFDMVSDAFKTATSEGGLFFNLMEKQSQSVGGLISALEGNIDESLKNIFSANSGLVKNFVDLLLKASEGLMLFTETAEQSAERLKIANQSEFIANLEKLIETMGGDSKAAIDATRKSLEESYDQLTKLNKELLLSSDYNQEDYDSRFKRIEQIKQELQALSDYEKEKEKERLKAALTIQAQKEEILNLIKLREESKKLTEQIDKTAVSDVGEINRLKQKKAELEAIIKAVSAINELESKSIKGGVAGLAGRNTYNQQTGEFESDTFKPKTDAETKKETDDLIKGLKRREEQRRELEEQNQERTAQLENQAELEVQIEIDKQNRIKQIRQAAFDFGIDLISQLLMATIKGQEETFVREKGNFDERLRLAGDNENAKKEIELEREAFELEQDRKQEEFQKRQANREKEIQIKQMVIQGLVNSLRALGQPPVPNFALAGLTAAFSAAQVAIAKTVGFKDGVIGLQGPGTGTSDSIPARLSKGESVITAAATSKSHDLLEAINSGKIDDSILRKLHVSGSGVKVVNDNKDLVTELKALNTTRYEDGYFTMMEIQKAHNLKVRIKSKYRS